MESGSHIYVNPADPRGKKLLETNGNFNPPAPNIRQELLRRSDWTCVLDVGANYGKMIANGGLTRRAKIVAIEPRRMPLLACFQDFATFIEVVHLPPTDKKWISDHFAIEAFDVEEKGCLVKVSDLNWEKHSGFYPYDVVIRRHLAASK